MERRTTMSISNERREVAENLREQLRYMRENNSYDEDADVVDCGNSAYRNIAWSVEPYGNFEKGNYVHIVERLADLIDPTCEVEEEERRKEDETEFRLSCGHVADMVTDCPPAFCPECGARVVDDDD